MSGDREAAGHGETSDEYARERREREERWAREDRLARMVLGAAVAIPVLCFAVWGLVEAIQCDNRCPDGTVGVSGPLSECRCRVETYVEPEGCR